MFGWSGGDPRCASDGPVPSLGGLWVLFPLRAATPFQYTSPLLRSGRSHSIHRLAGFVFYPVVGCSPLLFFAPLWLVWFRSSGHVMRIGWMPKTYCNLGV